MSKIRLTLKSNAVNNLIGALEIVYDNQVIDDFVELTEEYEEYTFDVPAMESGDHVVEATLVQGMAIDHNNDGSFDAPEDEITTIDVKCIEYSIDGVEWEVYFPFNKSRHDTVCDFETAATIIKNAPEFEPNPSLSHLSEQEISDIIIDRIKNNEDLEFSPTEDGLLAKHTPFEAHIWSTEVYTISIP